MAKMNWERVRLEKLQMRQPRPEWSYDVHVNLNWIRDSDWEVLERRAKATTPAKPAWSMPQSVTEPRREAQKPTRMAEDLLAEADSMSAKGRFRRARILYDKDRRRHPNRADAQWGFGYASYRLAKYVDAVAACKLSLRCDPSHDRALRTLGYSFMALGKWSDAVSVFEQLISRNPADFTAHLALSKAYRSTCEFQQAAVVLRKALGLEPRNATAYYNLGLCLLELGNAPEAVRHLEQLKAIDETVAARLKRAIEEQTGSTRSK